MNELFTLRREMRNRRKALSAQQRLQGQVRMLCELSRHPWYLLARRLAGFISNDGEPDIRTILTRAQRSGKKLYLPRIGDHQQIDFVRCRSLFALTVNRYGIAEPPYRPGECVHPKDLDLVLVPLVAFDRTGNRVGMGKGYYDRCFAYRRRRKTGGPRLLGVAWACQATTRIFAHPWDISLDGVLTETGLEVFKNSVLP